MVINSSQNINQEKDNEIERLDEVILVCEMNAIKNYNNKIKGPNKKRKNIILII